MTLLSVLEAAHWVVQVLGRAIHWLLKFVLGRAILLCSILGHGRFHGCQVELLRFIAHRDSFARFVGIRSLRDLLHH